jgi:Trypsin-like peptidase domain
MVNQFLRVYKAASGNHEHFVGTAFFVKPQIVLTAHHVVQACTSVGGVFLRLPNGTLQRIALDSITQATTRHGPRDLDVLYLTESAAVTPLLLAKTPPQIGDEVELHGFMDATQSLQMRPTSVSGYVGAQHSFSVADGVAKGMSGGAVMRNGELLGLIHARDQDSKTTTYFIPIDEICQALGIDPAAEQLEAQSTRLDLERVTNSFVGREQELMTLTTAVLGNTVGFAKQGVEQTSQRSSLVAIAALHGMAGVGKSWLADHFYVKNQQHFPGGYWRLALNAEAPSAANLLLSDLAQQLQIAASPAQLSEHVKARLTHPRSLLHIENIDSDQALTEVTELCNQLKGCPIVLSGRLNQFGQSKRWPTVTIKQMVSGRALDSIRLGSFSQSPRGFTLGHPLGGGLLVCRL